MRPSPTLVWHEPHENPKFQQERFMGHKKIAIGALVILLVAGTAGVSACVTNTDAPRTNIPGAQEIAQAIPIPGWQQANTNGFGDPKALEVSALEAFNGYLYAGTYNIVEPNVLFDGARIYRSPDGVTWTPVTQPGFQNPHDSAPPAILDFVLFGNRLYASTGRGGNPAQIWRASNGVNWAPMVTAGFGDPDIHDIAALAVYNGMIYAGASSQVSGARIFRSSTGDSNTWNPVTPAGPTMAGAGVTGLAVFNGALYATIESEAPVQIWRTSSAGSTWTTVVNNGFGDSLTTSTGGMAVFGGYLYVGAGNSAVGAQLWRSNDGANWAQAINPGFGDSNNQKVEMVFAFQNQLYASVKNAVTGIEVWRSADGALWEQVNQDGFGDTNNTGTNGSHATADFLSQLYMGTSNVVDGGELWRMLQEPTDTPTASQTPTPIATETVTSTATSTATPTHTQTQTAPPTNTPTLTPTDTSTPTPTATDTLTPSPTNTSTPTSTPSETFTATATLPSTPTDTPVPLSSTSGKVTGGGNIDLVGGKLTFGFVVQYSDGEAAPSGNLTFQDHGSNLSLKADSFNLLFIQGNHALITGFATVNNQPNVPFILDVDDFGEPGSSDMFRIQIANNGYSSGGVLSGGNIQVSAP